MGKKKTSAPPAEAAPIEPKPAGRAIDLQWIPIDLVIPNDWNPNEEDDIAFNLLQDEINQVGMISPIQVVPLDDGRYLIIGGEHRWRACKNLGHEEIPCALLTDSKWQETDLEKFATVRLNVMHGKLNPEKFMKLYKEMAAKYGEESMQRMMGYSDPKGFQRMLGWVKKGLKQSLPADMAADVDDATKDVRSVAELQAVIQEMFAQHGDTLEYSFMVFNFGKNRHVYIKCNAKMRRGLEKAMECCKQLKVDINDFMEPVCAEFIRKAAIDIERKHQEDAISGGSGSSGTVDPKDPKW